MRRGICLLVLFAGLWSRGIAAQESETQPGRVGEARESFAENAPLLDVKIDESFFNAREQRLREHYLNTPLGELPENFVQPAADDQPLSAGVPASPDAETAAAITFNRGLTDAEFNDSSSTVCEPSLAVRGNEVLLTGNWFACFSRDGGNSFAYRNPMTLFPAIPNRPFCCDQIALYVPSHDLMVWFLQHGSDASGNTVRLAVAHANDITNEQWRYYDFTPQDVGNWTGEWFDYPDVAATGQHLFISTNCFAVGANTFRRSVAIRIPLEELKTYAALNYRSFNRTEVGSLKLATAAGDTMYIGTHQNTASLRVFRWADGADTYATKDFAVRLWQRGSSAPGPDGRDWLGFVDGRVTAGWVEDGQPGFAWTSGTGEGFPRPNVRVAMLDYNAGTVTRQPHLWSESVAYAYPAATVSGESPLAVSVCYGGGSYHPSHAVGFYNQNSNAWSLTATANSDSGPDRNRWGDYLPIRVDGRNAARFATAGFTLEGGPLRTNIVPRYVTFEASNVEVQPMEAATLTRGASRAAVMPMERFYALPATTVEESDPVGRFRADRPALAASGTATTRSMAMMALEGESATREAVQLRPEGLTDSDVEFLRLHSAAEYAYDLPQSICTPDDRQQALETLQFPYTANCQLIITFSNGDRAVGTGWFLGPQCVITAGHCVHEGDGGNFFASVEVIPAMNGLVRPFGSRSAGQARLRASEAWKSGGVQAADYGAILLDEPFAAVNGVEIATLAVAVLDDSALGATELTISGYPADKTHGTQWFGIGPVDSLQSDRLRYMIDTFGGHSGSAVTGQVNGNLCVAGIHNYGLCPNKATRITAKVKADLDRWLAESTGN